MIAILKQPQIHYSYSDSPLEYYVKNDTAFVSFNIQENNKGKRVIYKISSLQVKLDPSIIPNLVSGLKSFWEVVNCQYTWYQDGDHEIQAMDNFADQNKFLAFSFQPG